MEVSAQRPSSMPSSMQVAVTHSSNPFIPMAGRKLGFVELHIGMTVTQALKKLDAHPGRARARLTIDGEVIPRAAWTKTKLTKECHIVLQKQAEGGGGGGGSSGLTAVLSIALMFAAPSIGGLIAQQFGLASATLFGIPAGTIFGGIVSIAGKFIIGALVPPPSAKVAQGSNAALPNQTYSVNGGQNSARPYQPFLLVFGQHRVYPDVSANARLWYENDDQYMSTIFNYGLTDVDLSDHKIGDTPVNTFENVTIEDVAPGAPITTAHIGNLETLDIGADLTPDSQRWSGSNGDWNNTAVGDWVTRTTPDNTLVVQLDVVAVAFIVLSAGDYGHERVNVDIEYKLNSASTWLPLGRLDFVSNKSNQMRRSNYFQLPAVGRYDVRARANFGGYIPNVSAKGVTRTRRATLVYLHSWQSEPENYAGQKRIGLKLKASGQLNGTINRFSSLATAKCLNWNGLAWVYGPTRNPAAWFLNFAKGKYNAAYGVLYGANLSDAQIDYPAIQEWSEFCTANNLTIDAVIDSPQSCAEVLTKIARCGRASPSWATGKLGVVWDDPNSPIVAMFGMFNIRKNTFKVNYISENLADEILVKFVNKNLNYTMDDGIRVTVPGTIGQPQNPVTLDLFGVTDPAIALQEARLLAASQFYHRRRISWETDIEGLLIKRGDVVQLSHDLTQWGFSGRIVAWNAGTKTLTLDQEVDRAGTNWINLRWPNGCFEILQVAAGSGVGDTIVLVNDLPTIADDGSALVDIGVGNPVHDWAYQYSPLTTPGKRVKITSLRPISHTHVQIEAVDDDPSYYSYSGGAYTPPVAQVPLDYAPKNLTVTQKLVSLRFNSSQSILNLSWDAVSGADYVIRSRTSSVFQGALVVTSDWSDIGSSSSKTFEVMANEGDTVDFEVSPLIKTVGLWGKASASVLVLGRTEAPPDVSYFKLIEQPGGIKQFFWQIDEPPIDLVGYEVRYSFGSTVRPWDQMLPLFAKDLLATSHENTEPSSNDIYTFAICAIDNLGLRSVNPKYITEYLDGGVFGTPELMVFPHELDWPGTKTACYLQTPFLFFDGGVTWNDVDVTWDSTTLMWDGVASGTMQYDHSVIDLGTVSARTIRASGIVLGALTITYSSSNDGITYSTFAEIPSSAVTARYFKFKWSVSGQSPALYRAQVIFY